MPTEEALDNAIAEVEFAVGVVWCSRPKVWLRRLLMRSRDERSR